MMFRSVKSFVLAAAVAVSGLSLMAQEAAGVAPKKVVKVLAVGNSFAGNANQYCKALNAADPENELQLTVANIGGCPLEKHVKLAKIHEENPADPQGIPYSFGKEKKSLKQLLTSDKWEYVTIQQFSMWSPDIKTYRPWAKELYDYIKKYCPEAQVVIHETWSYRSDDPMYKDGKKTHVDMYNHLHAAYKTIAGELGGLRIIPVGTAFQNALARPDWQYQADSKFDFEKAVAPALPDQTHSLHTGYHWSTDKKTGAKKLNMDGHHAGTAGCFLAGLVWREFFLGVDVRNNKFVPKGISEADAVILRQVAHDTVAAQNVTK